jgi:hypothetical protein
MAFSSVLSRWARLGGATRQPFISIIAVASERVAAIGLFAFRRLREIEAASQEVASFSMEQSQQQEVPVEKPKRQRRQAKSTVGDGAQ